MNRQSEKRSELVFDRRIEESREAMIRYARRQLGEHFSRSDAEDAVQAAFLEAWRDLPTLRNQNALLAWLRRITFKQCDRLRRARRVTVVVDEPGATGAEIPDPTPDPGSRLAATEASAVQQRLVQVALRSLPPGERVAVLLYYWGGGSCHELATFLGISITALKSRLHSARHRLRKRMNTMEFTTDENLPPPSNNQEILTESERSNMMREIEACYTRFTDAFEVQDPALVMPLFTDDYELIFPKSRNEPTWDKARIERDCRKCGIQLPGRYRIRVLIDGLLSVEREPVTGTIREATARATFISEWATDKPPYARIDTFALVGTEWKFRRTLSVGQER